MANSICNKMEHHVEGIKKEYKSSTLGKSELSDDNVIWLNELKKEPNQEIDLIETEIITIANHSRGSNSLKSKQNRSKSKNVNVALLQEKSRPTSTNINKVDHKFFCSNCQEECDVYCLKCQMLIHILDNNATTGVDRCEESVPKDILQLSKIKGNSHVVALKTVPKGVKFGPFDGLEAIPTAIGSTWKVKGGKLVLNQDHIQYSNWMQYINYARTCAEGNLSVFQYDNSLYYRSNCEIKIGEELLVYFGDEHLGCLDQNTETYLSVAVETEVDNVYGCTFCCLGFISEVYLARHKAACTKGTRIYIGSADLVRCTFCKMYLEEKEHMEHHVDYCCERYARKYLSSSSPANGEGNKSESDVKHQLQKIYNVIQKKHKCSDCPYQTNDRHDLKKHQYRHANIKPFECTTCKKRFTQKGHLNMHIKNKHEAVTDKEYKCRFCPYQTNGKGDFKLHLYVHDTVKRFECEICGKRFRQKANLQVHLKNLHLAVNSKKFACTKCDFRTNYKHSLDKHVNHTHNGPAPVTCHLCNGQFKQIYTLKQHIKYKHANVEEEKEFKCPVCPYEAQRRWCLKRHLATHDEEKQYNCHQCDYSTICKINLSRHMTKHAERKLYPCEICGKVFTRKGAFKIHIRHTHPIIVE